MQRVTRAAVHVDGREVAHIGPGLLVLLGVAHDDDLATAERLAAKIRALRVFADAAGRMNEPLGAREILCVSQFTLYGDAARGNRRALPPPPRPRTPSRCTSVSATRPVRSGGCSGRTCLWSWSTTDR